MKTTTANAPMTDISDIAESQIIPDDLTPLARIVADALAGGQPPARVAAEMGLRLGGLDGEAVILPGIVARDVTGDWAPPEHLPLDRAAEAAEAVAEAYDRPSCEGVTYWVHVATYFVSLHVEDFEGEREILAEGESCRSHRIARDPLEPPGDHDWRDDGPGCGVRGSGGGVVVVERCAITGWARVTDTWATDFLDGSQGHTTIAYHPPEGADVAEWLEAMAAERLEAEEAEEGAA